MKRKINDFLNKFRDGDIPWGHIFVVCVIYSLCYVCVCHIIGEKLL